MTAINEDALDNDSREDSAGMSHSQPPGFVLNSGEFEVFLLVDNSEVIGGKAGGKKTRREITTKELKANAVS